MESPVRPIYAPSCTLDALASSVCPHRLGAVKSIVEINQIMIDADPDGSGEIDFREASDGIRSCRQHSKLSLLLSAPRRLQLSCDVSCYASPSILSSHLMPSAFGSSFALPPFALPLLCSLWWRCAARREVAVSATWRAAFLAFRG